MKTLEIIDRLPVGEVVPKRVLAVLKRAKIISDYAPGGYLDGKEGDFWGTFEYKGRYFRAKYLSGCFYPYLVKADIKPTKRIDYIQFKGDFVRDRPCYLSDKVCSTLWNLHYKIPNLSVEKFMDYMHQKGQAFVVPPTRTNRRVNRTMSLWGAIC